MVYHWHDRRDVCYRLYIEERKPLEEIMQYMRDTYAFAPSKRAFQSQFRRWGFPSKQNPAHRNEDLVARVKELWETNTKQRDMLRILNDEGYDIKERELMRVRAKNRWLLRVANGMKGDGPPEEGLTESLAENSELPEEGPDPSLLSPAGPVLTPQVLAKRKERQDQMQVESDQRWSERKRRRRTRGWAGMPADPPGPPRFPSETTLDESKTFLDLTTPLYRDIRAHFQRICDENGITKKTIAGPEKWQQAKDRLIQESSHLQTVFWSDTVPLDTKSLALDVICTDVTKRLRNIERRMSLAEAKNTLGLNPEESRQLRSAFYGTLRADHFTSKLVTGDDHWQELKELWIQQQPILLALLAPGEQDPGHGEKVKAVEVLCRDVMKRLRDDQAKPTSKEEPHPTFASPTTTKKGPGRPPIGGRDAAKGISRIASRALATTPAVSASSDMQIDPSLLQAANDRSVVTNVISSMPPRPAVKTTSRSAPKAAPPATSASAPDAVYIRPHPSSTAYGTARVWLGKLTARNVTELRNLISTKWPNAVITRIDGIDKESNGREIFYLVEEDDELDAYLSHVQGRKATLVALMNQP